MTGEDDFCYVAADPAQPGAAWAAVVDDPKHAKDTAKTIADYVRRGAVAQRVTSDVAREMLMKWVRPAKSKTGNAPSVQLEL